MATDNLNRIIEGFDKSSIAKSLAALDIQTISTNTDGIKKGGTLPKEIAEALEKHFGKDLKESTKYLKEIAECCKEKEKKSGKSDKAADSPGWLTKIFSMGKKTSSGSSGIDSMIAANLGLMGNQLTEINNGINFGNKINDRNGKWATNLYRAQMAGNQ